MFSKAPLDLISVELSSDYLNPIREVFFQMDTISIPYFFTIQEDWGMTVGSFIEKHKEEVKKEFFKSMARDVLNGIAYLQYKCVNNCTIDENSILVDRIIQDGVATGFRFKLSNFDDAFIGDNISGKEKGLVPQDFNSKTYDAEKFILFLKSLVVAHCPELNDDKEYKRFIGNGKTSLEEYLKDPFLPAETGETICDNDKPSYPWFLFTDPEGMKKTAESQKEELGYRIFYQDDFNDPMLDSITKLLPDDFKRKFSTDHAGEDAKLTEDELKVQGEPRNEQEVAQAVSEQEDNKVLSEQNENEVLSKQEVAQVLSVTNGTPAVSNPNVIQAVSVTNEPKVVSGQKENEVVSEQKVAQVVSGTNGKLASTIGSHRVLEKRKSNLETN